MNTHTPPGTDPPAGPPHARVGIAGRAAQVWGSAGRLAAWSAVPEVDRGEPS